MDENRIEMIEQMEAEIDRSRRSKAARFKYS